MSEQPVILVIEDDEDVQDVIEVALINAGFEPVVAESGEEAITLLRSRHVEYRAVVIDVGLQSRMNGWAIARQARAIDPTFPIIYLGSTSVDEWRSQGVPDSILLRKPFAAAQLPAAVCQLLNMSG